MKFIRTLLGLKPRTQAELDAFTEKNRIEMAWRHQKQVHKELKAHFKQEYVDRGKLRQVYFRQEAGKTILYNRRGLAIANLSVPILTSTDPDAQRLDARTSVALNNIESTATQDMNNPLISDLTHGRAFASQTLEEQDFLQNQAPEILPDPALSANEPSANQSDSPLLPEPVHDMSHERGAREAVPVQSLLSRGPISLSHTDQVSRPTTGAPEFGDPANCPNAALSLLSLEPETSNPPGADASRTQNPPEQSMTHYQGAWSDDPTTALPMSDLSCEGSGTSDRHGGEIMVSELPPTIPDAFNIISVAPSHPVDVHCNVVEQTTFRVPSIQTQHQNSPCITNIRSSTNSSTAREGNAQLVTIASTSQQQPPTYPPELFIPQHLQNLGQSAGPSQDPKGKGKAEAEPEAESSVGFPCAFCYPPYPLTTSATYMTETQLIHNPQYASDWYDLSIESCCRLLVVNRKALDNCWVCKRLQYAISWMMMIFTLQNHYRGTGKCHLGSHSRIGRNAETTWSKQF